MNRSLNQDGKEVFASLILADKDLLFGRYDDKKGITKENKRAKWAEIYASLLAREIFLMPDGKDETYLRDVVWRNMVDCVKKKVDRKKKTGAGKVELLPYEKIIVEICGGSNSAGWSGLPVGESIPINQSTQYQVSDSKRMKIMDSPQSSNAPPSSFLPGPSQSSMVPGPSHTAVVPKKRIPSSKSRSSVKDILEIKFLRLRNRNLELKNKKLELEIARMENDLN